MSRFVRASKYRHVFGQPAKKEHSLENVKVTNSAWDTNIVSASGQYLSVNWNASGGGAFAILPLPTPFGAIDGFPHKLPESMPIARSHTAPVLDTDWSPHNDSIVASAGEDGKVMIWKVEASMFDGWGADGWVPRDFDPVLRIDASPRKIGQVLFHPTAANVVASSSGEYTVKLWDLANPEDPRATLTGHADIVQSMTFNPTGTLLVTTCRDRKLRLFDPRVGGEAVRINDGHSGIKGSRVTWMGEHDKIATTGFSKMSDRQVSIWDAGDLANVKTISLDHSAGVVMPFWTDNNILFLAGKGDGNIRYYEYESDSLHALSEHKSSEPQRGMCFLPRRALSVADCEIARAYKVHGSSIEPIAFIVPRKADSFQSDIFPPAPSIEPSLAAAEFFNGKEPSLKLISLADGAPVSAAAATSSLNTSSLNMGAGPITPATAASSFSAAPTPTTTTTPAVVQPTRTFSASSAAPAASSASASPSPMVFSDPAPAPKSSSGSGWAPSSSPSLAGSTPAPAPAPAPETRSYAGASDAKQDHLEQENARLEGELRDAREKIRNLELQVESIRANARKAAQALLDG